MQINLFKEHFLYSETIERMNNRLNDSVIYIRKYSEGKELKDERGKIKEINSY